MAKVKLTESQLARLKDSVLKKEMEKSVPSESTPEVTKSIKLTESKLNELINKVIEKETLKKKDNLISEENNEVVCVECGYDFVRVNKALRFK